jgi:hypothetical protein
MTQTQDRQAAVSANLPVPGSSKCAQSNRIDHRRRASRALDDLLGIDRTRRPVPWTDGGLELDYPTRDARGRELANAGWTP